MASSIVAPPDAETGWFAAWVGRLVFGIGYALSATFVWPCFRTRCSASAPVPRDTGLLIISNHQSFIDPVLLGIMLQRRTVYLARSTLFRFAALRWLIRALETIPIRREGVTTEALKEAIRQTERGKTVVIWPEGTRSPDGQLQSLKPGVMLLLRRIKCPVFVAGLEGAHAAWPRHQKFPRAGWTWIHFDPFVVAPGLSTEASLAALEKALQQAIDQARSHRQRLRERSGWSSRLFASGLAWARVAKSTSATGEAESSHKNRSCSVST